jgi:hypothetical protein
MAFYGLGTTTQRPNPDMDGVAFLSKLRLGKGGVFREDFTFI